jgi:hypothetical protein
MRSSLIVLLVLGLGLVLMSPPLMAHKGRTNAKGCHAGADGKVHCHQQKSAISVGKRIKKGPDGKCYPPNHPQYKSIKATAEYDSIKQCLQDR